MFKLNIIILVLKACCNGDNNCLEYKQPEEMFGVACCGLHPMSEFENICCDNVIRSRRQGSIYVDRCCGNQTLSFDQTCCQGVVHNVPNGECCGAQAYSRSSQNTLCCNEILNLNVPKGSMCCGSLPYDGGIKESCCGGVVHQKEQFDGCCSNQYDDEETFIPYNTKISFCCDKPIQKAGSTKCCYLRKNGTFVPQSYDFTTSCCAYPYTSITEKINGTCVPIPTLLSKTEN